MLETGVVEASEAPVLRRHVVVVLVDRLDMATARALQYARMLAPDDLRAVHFDVDTKAARELEADWGRLGPGPPAARHHRVPRPPARAGPRWSWWPTPPSTATPSAPCCCPGAASPGSGSASCTTARPTRSRPCWVRCPTSRATIVPFTVGGRFGERVRSYGRSVQRARLTSAGGNGDAPVDTGGTHGGGPDGPARRAQARPGWCWRRTRPWPSAPGRRRRSPRVVPRQRTRVAGRVKSVRVQPRAGTSNLECVLSDGTGGLLLVFQGRPRIAGIEPGARLVAEGMVGTWGRRPAMLNPSFELVQGAPVDPAEK